MKELLTPDKDGFRGYFHAADPNRCILVIIGDDGDDLLDRAFAKWLTGVQGISALCMALRQDPREDTGVHSWPLERVEDGIRWLKGRGFTKIGILGMSMQGALVLSAAARIPELSLVLALSPCDFVPWGFVHGQIGREKNAEWPSGGSAFSWRGEDLPFQPATLPKEEYWALFCQSNKEFHEIHSRTVFDASEKNHPIVDNCRIPVENIRGKVVLVGCEDDSMWDSARYIRRMMVRRNENTESILYPVGTHLMVPQSLLMGALPLVGGLITRMYVSGRKHAGQCRKNRQDLDQRLTKILTEW